MREKINFDGGWMFHRGDIDLDFPANGKGASYRSAKTVRMLWGPASVNYDTGAYCTERWYKVDLPHDYIIDGTPDEKYSCGIGFLPYDNAWYRKKFTLEPEDANKRLTLFFEGVATHATIYLNGCLMKHNFCGYNSFEVDITDIAKPGEENVLAVYVNTQHHEGWWYEGGGIYRHVWLCKTDKISVDLWGVYVKPKKQREDSWNVDVEVTLRNDSTASRRVRTECEVIAPNGESVASCSFGVLLGAMDKKTGNAGTVVSAPELWSPDTPNLYFVRTHVFVGDNEVDTLDTRFGFREIYADPKEGLFVNGKHYKIKGLCGHADCGLFGKAVPDNIHRYKVQLMKEMGANGYRTTHYPQAEVLMDALDENGFLVMDETRWFESTEEGIAQLEMLVKRDRNRPSVIFWSIGNEEPLHAEEEGRKIAERLKAVVKRLDDTRYVMTAVVHSPDKATVYDTLDVVGVNYSWDLYEAVHKRYPDKPVVSSENAATSTTRRWYYDNSKENGYVSCYDHDTNRDWRSREYTWKYIAERAWLMGGYQWIAFEHRGEAVWPRLCSQSGAVDLFMQKKDAFYQNMSHWSEKDMIHLLPHWNFDGREGEPIKVFAYTNLSDVELFLNGESMGRKEVEPYGHGEWYVPYAPGTLKVVGYRDGKEVVSDVSETTGRGVALKLELDTKDVKAGDIALVSCYVVDEKGREVPTASPLVNFYTSKGAAIYSTGSDISDHSSIYLPTRRMRAGRATAAVKLGCGAKSIKVYAQADGLNEAAVEIEL